MKRTRNRALATWEERGRRRVAAALAAWAAALGVLLLLSGCPAPGGDSTLDTTPPTILEVVPGDGQDEVPVGGSVSVAFSEPMDTASAQGAFSLSDAVDEVGGSFSWSGETMTFDPSTDLSYDTTYYVKVTTGARDTSNNSLLGEFDSSFSTAMPFGMRTYAVDSIGNVGEYTAIALDSSGGAHISYYDYTNEDLKYATNTSGSWTTATIDSSGDVGMETSIALDSNNRVHISYDKGGSLGYATNGSGSWATSVIDSGQGVLDTSIAADSDNNLHICYYEWFNKQIRYLTNASGSWVAYLVDTTGSPGGSVGGAASSIALDSNDNVHISYYDTENKALKYATNAGGSWATHTIDNTGDMGWNNSIALDSNNKVHIGYYAITGYDLKYATDTGGSWATCIVDGTGIVGRHNSIALDSADKVHMTYWDYTNYDLKYATNAGGSWAAYSIDIAGFVGLFTSLALDSGDRVHASYYDTTQGDLKYATNR